MLDKDPLFQWIQKIRENNGYADSLPSIGSVPNQFAANFDSVKLARKAVDVGIGEFHQAWRRICDVVWRTYVAGSEELGVDVQAIWQRQTEGYWEVAWTIMPGEEPRGGAHRSRKLWRTHRLPEEYGDKCMVMPDLQELSGYTRARGPHERVAQQRFWEAIQKSAGSLNMPDGDRLSAIALVKRLFVDVSEEAIGGRIDYLRWGLDGVRRCRALDRSSA